MATKKQPTARKERWAAKGHKLDRETTGDPHIKKFRRIPIREESRSVTMGAGDEPYGIPIDAKLAVALIRNFHRLLKSATKDLKINFDDRGSGKLLKDILNRSAAITIDKNIILKILSQPGCEGVRFYLCLKSVQKKRAKEKVMSLVTVGVDSSGKDLFYDPPPKQSIKQINTTESLIGEYAHPPGVTVNIIDIYRGMIDKATKEYAILNHALNGL